MKRATNATIAGFTFLFYIAAGIASMVLKLAWLGVLASTLLVVILPLELAGLVRGPITTFTWLPALVFELALALWLLVKGVALPARMQSA